MVIFLSTKCYLVIWYEIEVTKCCNKCFGMKLVSKSIATETSVFLARMRGLRGESIRIKTLWMVFPARATQFQKFELLSFQ